MHDIWIKISLNSIYLLYLIDETGYQDDVESGIIFYHKWSKFRKAFAAVFWLKCVLDQEFFNLMTLLKDQKFSTDLSPIFNK